MNINFALILVILTIASGAVYFFDHFVLAKKRVKKGTMDAKRSPWIEYPSSLFPVILLVLLIRSFIFEPFRIPSSSLEPTLLIGDLILVNKFNYGLRLPVLNNKVISISEPKRGDIVVFRWPVDPKLDYIKRVIGLPGDHILYKNKELFINGKAAKQTVIGYTTSVNQFGQMKKVEKRVEELNGVKHAIYIDPALAPVTREYTVPKGHYFMMGDNRDDSSDSRYWGFLPEKNLLGKAVGIWMSWDKETSSVRFERIAKRIK